MHWQLLSVTAGCYWQLLAVTGSFPDTSEGSSPNAGMVLAGKVIGSYWQLMAVLVSTLLAVTIIGSYWQLAVPGSYGTPKIGVCLSLGVRPFDLPRPRF